MKSNTTSTNTAWGSAWQPRAPGWAGALCLAAASPSLPRGDRAPCPLSTRGRHFHLLFFLFWFLWEAVLPSGQGVDASIGQSWVRVLTHSSSEVNNGLYLLTPALAVTTIPYFPFFLSLCCSWSCLPPSGHLQAPGVTMAQEPKPLGYQSGPMWLYL